MPKANEEDYTIDGVDSPPFSPVSFIIERPHLPPQTYTELQQSCATIVQELQPVDHHVYEAIAATNKIPGKWSDDNQAYKSATQNPKPKPKHHRRTDSAPTRAPKSYTHVPTNAATSFKATATTRKPSHAIELLDPTTFPTPPSNRSKPRALPDPSRDPLAHLRADIASRPKTSAAACIDYKTPSATTSNSNSRSNTTYDAAGHSGTGLTSLALTPRSHRLSSQSPSSSASASATAKAWMAQELARRRSEAEKAIQQRANHSSAAARPSARASLSDPGPPRDDDRVPRSRTGSISQGIKDYIRPRAGSIDSVRTTHSSTPLPNGQTSNGNNKWWSGANLKRKGSWSSFRSSSLADKDASEECLGGYGGVGGTPDLNRALPALPALDTWMEEREKLRRPVHISQMMRAGVKTVEELPGVSPRSAGAGAGAGHGAEKTAVGHMGGPFQERMQMGGADAGSRAKVSDQRLGDVHPLLRPHGPSVPSAVVAGEKSGQLVGLPVSEKEKKVGLRKRLSRFWGRGRGKAVVVLAN